MEDTHKPYALQLWGDYLRRKRLEHDLLQYQLGVSLAYSTGSAKQAISQLENGRTWVPRAKLDALIEQLKLDPSWVRQLDYFFHAHQYGRVVELLRKQLQHDFGLELPTAQDINSGKPLPKARNLDAAYAKSQPSLQDKLVQLKQAWEQQLISQAEYESTRKRLLDQFASGI
jgi:transcriptional regulator with XRE-family HTH domain